MSHEELNGFLRDEDRVLIAAWALPNEGAISDGQRRAAMDNFTDYLKRNGVKVADVARSLGTLREFTIRDLQAGIWPADADDQVRKLNLWIEQHARTKAARPGEPFVSTKVAQTMLAIAKLVRENGTMGLAIGPAGIGKSRCAQAIHETYVGSVYLRVNEAYRSPRAFLLGLAEKLGVRQTAWHRMSSCVQERVTATLTGSDRLLIIDEAHKLKDQTLEVLRDLHDEAGVPILLVCVKDLHDRILKTVNPDGGQLYSRFDIVQHLSQGQDVYSGGKALFTVEDIKQLYQVTPIRLSPDATRYLQDVANQLGHGSLRRCRALLRNAIRRARRRQGMDDASPVTVIAADLEFAEAALRQESGEQEAALTRRRDAAALTGT